MDQLPFSFWLIRIGLYLSGLVAVVITVVNMNRNAGRSQRIFEKLEQMEAQQQDFILLVSKRNQKKQEEWEGAN